MILYFEGFLMPSIGTYLAKVYSYLESGSNSAWASALTLGVQMKMFMLIRHAQEKENLSSRRYERNKWSFGDTTSLCIEISDDLQINYELDTFLNLFNQGNNS